MLETVMTTEFLSRSVVVSRGSSSEHIQKRDQNKSDSINDRRIHQVPYRNTAMNELALTQVE